MGLKWSPGVVAILLVGLGAVLLLSADEADRSSPGDRTVVVEMDTYRYGYEPGTNGTLNVSRGSEVVLRIASHDVTHGLAIREYGINVEIPAGQTVEVRFTADRAGIFTMYCTVFCGAGHPEHQGVLHVV